MIERDSEVLPVMKLEIAVLLCPVAFNSFTCLNLQALASVQASIHSSTWSQIFDRAAYEALGLLVHVSKLFAAGTIPSTSLLFMKYAPGLMCQLPPS